MRAFRNSGADMIPMPKLLNLSHEATFAHWTQPSAEPPRASEAVERLAAEGPVSEKCDAPPRRMRSGEGPPPGVTLRGSRTLRPDR